MPQHSQKGGEGRGEEKREKERKKRENVAFCLKMANTPLFRWLPCWLKKKPNGRAPPNEVQEAPFIIYIKLTFLYPSMPSWYSGQRHTTLTDGRKFNSRLRNINLPVLLLCFFINKKKINCMPILFIW